MLMGDGRSSESRRNRGLAELNLSFGTALEVVRASIWTSLLQVGELSQGERGMTYLSKLSRDLLVAS